MTKTIKFNEVVTAHGNILRAHCTVAGQEFTLEMGLDRTWLNIEKNSCCESCVIDEDGDVVAEGGECVTSSWTAADWVNLTNSVGAKGQ